MSPFLIDCHAHLCDASFSQDLGEVLERAGRAGIGAIITVSETLADSRRNLALAAQYTCLKPAAGLYPEFANLQETEQMVEFIRQNSAELYAIGEVGLDFWLAKDEPTREVQRAVFQQFIYLSAELHLPLNVHSRSAGRHAVAMLLEKQAKQVQLHAFDSKVSTAMPAVEAGYFFSVPPSIVRSRQKQKLVKQLPLSCLLLESDSPVLGPDPTSRNEPANVPIALQAIADIKGISRDAVYEAVLENTAKLYGDLA